MTALDKLTFTATREPWRRCLGTVSTWWSAMSPTRTQGELGLKEIGRIKLRTTVPLLCDPYSRNRDTDSFILIDEAAGVTVAAVMIND